MNNKREIILYKTGAFFIFGLFPVIVIVGVMMSLNGELDGATIVKSLVFIPIGLIMAFRLLKKAKELKDGD